MSCGNKIVSNCFKWFQLFNIRFWAVLARAWKPKTEFILHHESYGRQVNYANQTIILGLQ